WFFSGGGDLKAGVELGRRLRDYGMTVRVPNRIRLQNATGRKQPRDVYCVSSCTVAFMGGLFRYMDDGATYRVHAASGYQGGIDKETLTQVAKGDFVEIARFEQIGARRIAKQLLRHFQNTLLKLVRAPQQVEDDQEYINWAVRARPRLPYTNEQLAADRNKLGREGIGAAQDILMRLERDAMSWAINDLRAELPQLGPRAEPALKMLEAMYDVSILDTQGLTRQTMLRMGYLTQDVSVN
ncbi:MAG TPA: hypothetical protein VMS40_02660, partial [Vicinamibacterales bacterium]|nr:hypothetical protein [Vicinamibacterales bacterium]